MAWLWNIKNFLLYLLLPRTCFCCGADLPRKDAGPLCQTCKTDLTLLDNMLVCRRCGLPLPDGGAHCYNCRGSKAAKYKCSLIRSSLKFTPASRSLVHALKYQKYVQAADFFVPFLYKTYLKNPEYLEADYIVPVPIHSSRLKERGFNQSLLLARGLSARCGVPCAELITRTKKTKSQTSLGREERLNNVQSAFACADAAAVKRKAIILIDDVCTTGATLEECAKVLKAAGAREVLALTALRE